MGRGLEEARTELVERIAAHVLERLPSHEAPLAEAFIRQYYLSVSSEDLSSRSVLDLYAAVVSHWHFISQRTQQEYKVRVYNPQLEQHGWQSSHTVIELIYDDMPFLIDSVRMELNRLGLNTHLLIHMVGIKLQRDLDGRVLKVLPKDNVDSAIVSETPIFIEVTRQSDPAALENIRENILRVIKNVDLVVQDWPEMKVKSQEILEEWQKNPSLLAKPEIDESLALLNWINNDNFIFLGFQDYTLSGMQQDVFQVSELSGLGIFRNNDMVKEACEFGKSSERVRVALSAELFTTAKAPVRSSIHRPVFMDYLALKRYDESGKIKGERRFVGLYTSVTYHNSPTLIPGVRQKISTILKKTSFPKNSHDYKVIVNILETLPRDDLFQVSEPELFERVMGIFHLKERPLIRLFVSSDTFGQFLSCLVYVPRETYSSNLRERMQSILTKYLQATEITFITRFSESILARVHFNVHLNPDKDHSDYDLKLIENKLIEAARTWQDYLLEALIEHYGEEVGQGYWKRYAEAFSASYQEVFAAPTAVIDIEYIENLKDHNSLAMSLYRPLEESEDSFRFKLFHKDATIPLSDVVPILENMGLRIISERSYSINIKSGDSVWINDYRMVDPRGRALNTDTLKDLFQDAFACIWRGNAENDGFNRLVINSHLNWREITMLRAYAKYFWQTGFVFSQTYIENTLLSNADLAQELVNYFELRFNPALKNKTDEMAEKKNYIEKSLEAVENLNEDRILRRYLSVISATVRTNYYQKDADNCLKPYMSFKIDSQQVPELPLPVPLFEIFVYAPWMEGIHLRAANVARGGIRWSDRHEDFRTEILGLMKAQQVKNAVIVPLGAKGGFVAKRLPKTGREQIMDEVVFCYKTLIRGLLDLTDNLSGSLVVPPQGVLRYDLDDPYLVVAADKGTATFSDIANSLSKEYGYWLGDAFASGGSSGYDHKKMGITARGAWESVKRHFSELNINPESDDITVVGIGDMSGDVFGNGLILSKHIKLIAAFNHMHIFLDPNPNPALSFEERVRLFNLPRSSWSDYKPELISEGGGVFLRSLKSISLSPQIQEILGIVEDKLEPTELIKAILKSSLDLLWNGGVGTYVKASSETNIDVGDRTNDNLRINGKDLRFKVVAEGGNLGFTQRARVEYALAGGRINTDAIDNSAGVNCSDNEVNIKILINECVMRGDLTEKHRNELLVTMTDEVAELVLTNNRQQTEAISFAVTLAHENLDMYQRLIEELENSGKLDRAFEFLPTNEEIENRRILKQGLTRPEMAVLMAYTKIILKNDLLASKVPEEPFVFHELLKAFPTPLQGKYAPLMDKHRLKREIIATRLSNAVINDMGIGFISRLQDETGELSHAIVLSYFVAREVYEMAEINNAIKACSHLDFTVQLKMLQELNRLVRRGTRWFLRNRRSGMDLQATINHFKPKVAELSSAMPKLLSGAGKSYMDAMAKELMVASVPESLAYRIGGLVAMFSALDIIEAATTNKFTVRQVAAIYYAIGDALELGWFREQIKTHSISNHWEALARASFRDDLDRQQRHLTIAIMQSETETIDDIQGCIDRWLARHHILLHRWQYFIDELKATASPEFTMFSVALRELLDLSEIPAALPKSA